MERPLTELLFVYGTLRRGERAHGLLRKVGARWQGRGNVGAELFDLGAFPGAASSAVSAARVRGEVYWLPNPNEALRRLDQYERAPLGVRQRSLFRRELTSVRLKGGSQVQAWIYWLNRLPASCRRIRSGDYLKKR